MERGSLGFNGLSFMPYSFYKYLTTASRKPQQIVNPSPYVLSSTILPRRTPQHRCCSGRRHALKRVIASIGIMNADFLNDSRAFINNVQSGPKKKRSPTLSCADIERMKVGHIRDHNTT